MRLTIFCLNTSWLIKIYMLCLFFFNLCLLKFSSQQIVDEMRMCNSLGQVNGQVCEDLRWGRCYESYSENTEIVRKMTSFVLGLQGNPPERHPRGYPFVAGRQTEATSITSIENKICLKYYIVKCLLPYNNNLAELPAGGQHFFFSFCYHFFISFVDHSTQILNSLQ